MSDENAFEATSGPATPPGGAEGASSVDDGVALTFGQTATARSICGLTLTNAILLVLTLGFWRFWARSRVRQHLWARTTINGEPLDYTGTGVELFKAFLVVVFLITLPSLIGFGVLFFLFRYFLPPSAFVVVFAASYFVFILFTYWLLGLAIYLVQRYRLSRTSWRGVRFGLPGSAKDFASAFLGYLLLLVPTLGWSAPVMDIRLARRFWGSAVYGDTAFEFEAPDGKSPVSGLYGPYALAWFGSIIALIVAGSVSSGIVAETGADLASPAPGAAELAALYGGLFTFLVVSSFTTLFYQAALMRRIVGCITIDGVRFSHEATTLGLLWLYLGNALIVVFTLGIGVPFTHVRTLRFVVHRLRAEGKVSLATIGQNPDSGPAIGEGLADALDLGTI